MAAATPIPILGAKSPRPDAGFLWDGIVNGPVRSRRLGMSLGLNLLPPRSKLCTFDCPYCECGFNTPKAAEARWPSPDEVAHSLRRALTRLGGRAGASPDSITFAGNGEPTMHPRFPVVVDRVLEVRSELAPSSSVGILTNGLAAGKPSVREALLRLDARMVKLDPGPPELVNGVRYDQARLVADARGLAPVIIQAMVTKGFDWDGSSEASLAAWLPLVAAVEPAVVHLYSLDRAPADPTLQNVPRERLEQMAQAIRETLPRVVVRVF